MTSQDHRPFASAAPDLIADLVATLARLMRGELALARAEIMQGARAALLGLAMILVALILVVTAVQFLAGAGVAGLVHAGLRPWQAQLVMGGGLVAVAGVIGVGGLRRLRPDSLLPHRAYAGLCRDVETLKPKVKTDATS